MDIAFLVVFVLASFVGIEVISKVPATLHTPLMSGSNAISGITIVGALVVAGGVESPWAKWVGLAALVPITIAGVSSGLKAWTEGSYFFGILNLPEWPGYFLYSIGIGVFLLRLIDLLVHDLLCALGAIEDDDPSRARP